MNSVNLLGRLTRTPDLKHTSQGTAVTSFTLAVDDYNKTEFIDCVAWRNTAEHICRYFTKGQRMGVTGKLTVKEFEKGGEKQKKAEVIVSNVDFCESKKDYEIRKVTADDFEDIEDTDVLPF